MHEFEGFRKEIDAPLPSIDQDLVFAIARRRIHDAKLLMPGDAFSPQSNFIYDAAIDATAHHVKAALKAPTPFAALFDDASPLIDSISNGDFIALTESEDITTSTPQKIRLYGKAALLMATSIGEIKPPEYRFTHFMAMYKDSHVLADEHGTSPATVYEDDALYHELIRRNIEKDVYEAEVSSVIDACSLDALVNASAMFASLAQQIENNPEGVEKNGFTIDNAEIEQYAVKLRENEFIFPQLAKEHAASMDEAKEHFRMRIESIWRTEDSLPQAAILLQ